MDWLTSPASAQTAEALHAAQQAGDRLLDMGPFGALLLLILLAVGTISVVLWREVKSLQGKLTEAYKEHGDRGVELMERFATLAGSGIAAIHTNTVALNTTNETLHDVLDVVRTQPAANEAIVKALDRNYDKIDKIDRGGRS